MKGAASAQKAFHRKELLEKQKNKISTPRMRQSMIVFGKPMIDNPMIVLKKSLLKKMS